ncbi:hypothetical protein [Kordia jejudonensis]|uniref:hypothetical protein n=1 Tax=Kordia jejudonensis TaxID=1348245 RepID=UPI000629B089|nr:hypothetical protein [Kordia jejudonensis]
MKKKNFRSLSLNKKSISVLSTDAAKGGSSRPPVGQSVDQTCTGMASCGNCTVDCSTNPYESIFLCNMDK